MALKKQFLKTKSECKVTFKVDKDVANGASSAFLVGDFNGWNATAHPMKPLKDGSFSVTLNLPAGEEYEFRYLLDGHMWENDEAADRYVFSDYGNCENSVVAL